MKFGESRFARHPHFRYFALNTEMRWRALQTGRIYAHQHPHDAHLQWKSYVTWLSVRVKHFLTVLHYAVSLRGTRQYLFRQHNWLIAMVDSLGLPTIFFTHSATDLYWPEPTRLICPDDPDFHSSRNTAIADCSSNTAFTSLLKLSMLVSLVLPTIGYALSGSTVAAPMFRALHGSVMLPVWKSFWLYIKIALKRTLSTTLT